MIARILVLVASFCLWHNTAKAETFVSQQGTNNLAIVFLHGFRSSSEEAFGQYSHSSSMSSKIRSSSAWLTNGKELKDSTLVFVDYPAGFCDRQTLPRLANRVKTDLSLANVFENHEHVVFIAHSLGGLVAKKLILDMDESERERVAGIVLLGVPSDGSSVADAAEWLRLGRNCSLLRDLTSLSENSILQDLTFEWSALMRAPEGPDRVELHCGYELLPTSGRVVVPQERVDQVCDSSFAFNYNHSDMSNPVAGSTELGWVFQSIAQSVDNNIISDGAPTELVDVLNVDVFASARIYQSGLQEPPNGASGGYDGLFSRQVVSQTGKPATAQAHLPESMYCYSDQLAEPRATAFGQGTVFRTGRTSYQFRAETLVEGPSYEPLCELNSGTVHFFEAARAWAGITVKAQVQVRSFGETVTLFIDGVPSPNASLTINERVVEPVMNIERIREGEALYSGVIQYFELAPGNYFLDFRSTAQVGTEVTSGSVPRSIEVNGSLSIDVK